MKTFKWVIVAIAVVGVAAGGYGVYQRLISPPAKAEAEETVPVQRGNLMITAAAFGSISLPQKVKLSFPTGGALTEVGVQVGDAVALGQVIARLDEGPLRQAIVQAQIALKNAELALKKTRELY
ncbi:MAG: biotin/lipoyl-binding protein, partial [Chloroflexota bacterium]